MLPKKRRIQRSEFPYILSNGVRFNSPHLLLYLLKNQADKPFFESKISFSVSKKVCSKATDRNKLRRRGYSVINKNLNHIKQGFICFFVFKKGSNVTKFSDLEKEILTLLSNALVII